MPVSEIVEYNLDGTKVGAITCPVLVLQADLMANVKRRNLLHFYFLCVSADNFKYDINNGISTV
jgi:hypothetical protein